MKSKLLSVKERYAVGKKLIKLAKEITGAEKLGSVQKVAITAEVSEPLTVELKFYM